MSIIDICKSVWTSKSGGYFAAFVFRTTIFIQASPQSNVTHSFASLSSYQAWTWQEKKLPEKFSAQKLRHIVSRLH